MMRKIYLSFTLCILAGMLASAAPRYWVGPLDGNWNNAANWSATSGGAGGAGVPGINDSVVINRNARINVDVSPTVESFRLTGGVSVTLYTGVPISFTVTDSLNIPRLVGNNITTLKDSTSADVPFNFVLNASTNAAARILGQWVFEGGVAVSAGNGPTFSAAPGARVSFENAFPDVGAGVPGGQLSYRQNTPDIISSPSTLSFGHSTFFILENNPRGAIPDAYWEGERWVSSSTLYNASYILVSRNLTGELRHLSSRPTYGSIRVALDELTADASLALPHGTLLKGNLEIFNTNNHTLTLLSSTGPSDSVTATIGIITSYAARAGGDVTISATTAKVALARATGASRATKYRLQVNDVFSQTAGNFSLQDSDEATGSSILAIRGSLSQSGGTFFTNSTAIGPDARFVVEMDTPPFPEQGIGFTYTGINMSSGTIDNGRNMVTLRINYPAVLQPVGGQVPYQVTLARPLEVGRLDLAGGRLTTTSTNVLTVRDPDVATAVKVGSGYVNGPLRRRTNSTNAYVFPTGKVSTTPLRIVADSCVIIPASGEPSEYQAEYFFTRYADTQNVRPPLRGVSVDEYWNVSRISGAEAKVGLFVNQRVPRAAAGDGLVVARYNGREWVSEQGSILTPGDTAAGSVVSRTLPDFGPFTFGYYPADSVPQLFVYCPADIIAYTDSASTQVSFKAESTANATIVYRIGATVITSPYNFPLGTTTVDVTATDNSSNATCSFRVTVYDAPAVARYWVGPLDGNWNNAANWSATSGGAGGAGVPGIYDSVVINRNARINVDVSPTVESFRITNLVSVTLYTGVPTTFTVTDSLYIPRLVGTGLNLTTLKDSTSADVPFNFVLNASTNAVATILGQWVFEGGVPVSAGNGPTFTAAPGARITVLGTSTNAGEPGGRIVYKQNTPDIISSPSTLIFSYNGNFVLEDNPRGAIPDAYWEGERWTSRFSLDDASFIRINGNLTGELRHLSSRPSYGSMIVSLDQLRADASLALPHGTLLKGNLEIRNTNSQTLTLLSSSGPSDSVRATIGVITSYAARAGGDVTISGNTTKVALARATGASAATTYRLQVNDNFSQTGGNFSLQDANDVTGSSTLATRGSLSQSGGTFFTNSTATGPANQFVVEMDTPPFPEQGVLFTYTGINMSSGTIDNGRNVVTLRINHPVVFQPANNALPYQVTLGRALEVGRLDLLSGRLTTTTTSVLTVKDPDVATAVKVGSGYVNGPIRRRTNSTNAYVFPTGRASDSPARIVVDSCLIIPASGEPSEYQAEYFFTRYADTQNVQPPLRGVSVDEYWNVSRISGADAKVGLFVNQRVPRAAAGDGLVVARYNGREWVSEQGSLLTPGDTAAGSVVSRALSDFGPFTFGYYPPVITPVFVNCPSNIAVNTVQNSCNALVDFKAESRANATIVYRIGATVITSPYNFPRGTTTVDVTASNNSITATCSFTVTVNDIQAPEITGISANPATLSPADNEWRNVRIDYSATDNCGPVTTTLSVTSNQPPTGNDIDWEIVDGHNVRLRAAQSGEDRMYTITITSTDESGNQTVKTVEVTVPKTTVTEKIKLDLRVMPNPSKTYFTLYVRSNSDLPATLQVFDLFGRVKEVRRFYPAATIRLGDNYRPGVYFVKITQGNAEVYTALLKL